MSQKTHVQRPLRPTFRPRTSTRSGFVVYSGLGRPKPKANQNANKTRVPYRYTKQQKWKTFVTNGRPWFHKNCLLLCDVIFEAGNYSFWEESHSHLPGEHAEVKALRHISTKEQQDDTVARFVAMYLSYSPCANCADVIIDFSMSKPQCQLYLGFSCLFRHKDVFHRDGLRRLNAAPSVFLGVFTNLEWKRVAEATGISFRYHVPTRQTWDSKWKAEFENILKEQPGTTASRPSVPSQKRDRTSVMTIQLPHIPQDKGSTAGAATSSVLPQGRASWMWWQSRGKQQEELLEVVRVETAEPGTTALHPSVPSQDRDRTSAMIQHNHIPQDQGSTAGAATSSVLSQGRASWMWWQSRGEQQEELLEAVRVETAEVNAAVTRRVTSRSLCYGILTLVIVMIGALMLYFAFR